VNGIPRVVFDTNILFSAVGWLGNPNQCVQAARQGKCLSVICEPILVELAEKFQLKRGFDAAKAAETTDEIRAFSKVIAIPGTLKVIAADPDDDAVLECAVVGQAQYLVSGDRHLLGVGNYQGIQIVKAAEFLAVIQSAAKA
jgi:putative PIN family toxin of toxin-antitoxin system